MASFYLLPSHAHCTSAISFSLRRYPSDILQPLFTHLCGSAPILRPFLPKYNHSPLSVPQSALWPNALMIRPYSTPARGLLGAPWQDSALSPGIFRKQWAPWEAANGENPGPGCTQLGSGTVELLNWRKIALYPGPLCLHSSLSCDKCPCSTNPALLKVITMK